MNRKIISKMPITDITVAISLSIKPKSAKINGVSKEKLISPVIANDIPGTNKLLINNSSEVFSYQYNN